MSRAIEDAIRKRYAREFEEPEGVPTAYPNAEFTPPGKAAASSSQGPVVWARLTITVDETRQQDLGKTAVRERTVGLVIVQLFVEQGAGTARIHELADKARRVFRRTGADGVTYRTPTARTIGASVGWFQINVTAPFYADAIE